ncbi:MULTISPECIES: nucleoside triphosphate pyrophosphohydrolase [unclassified Lysinibacillus]|uniref:nucleoside triphosphate pyrophosphohydrolase n=1 Tax=unclassified Lysinibacillus TaxID=2636778 RepID=UPI000885E74B|nr:MULTISPECIES: nucleoside triphosphate pyrophosphohydrolase [unclassified Lysinibacillus]SCZ08773.1 tetrapyrrole methylase family protein / MazG family protein [Lysinibacillus sp. SG9]SDB53748.1 tetrapyrrole methylase family protein / MazG family protein [Lysinibacillus sp. TC-37]SFT17819.1 tetrapyrrole methylase family protein / MazG family protein [Lysinibacillus sp. SG55]
MKTLTIIGLGAGDFNQLQMGVYRKLKAAKKLYVRTIDHPVLEELAAEGVKFESFDKVYEKHDAFQPVYAEIANALIEAAAVEDIMYAVPGHPLVAEQTVQLLIAAADEGKIKLVIEGGQSFIDPIFGALKIDPIEGFQLLDGTGFSMHDINMRQHILIAQVYDTFSASEVKLTLMEKYDDEYPVTVVTAAGSTQEQIVTVPLYELDQSVEVNNLTTVYVPPVKSQEEALKDWTTFRQIIATLRGPNGCPWDQKQTHESLKKYLLEEAHEYLAAIDAEDDFAMIEELGDVLLQVFLHAQIGEDEGYFTLEDVLASISEKMIRRHPHVFGDVAVEDADDVVANWEAIKAEEKGTSDKPLLDEEYRASSALQTAFNYQKRAAKVGFDWPDVDGAWDKFDEEWQEFRQEVTKGSNASRLDEFGDVLFTLVNLARFYKLSPEEAMLHANEKFARRFGYVEEQVKISGKSFSDFTLEQLDAFWNEAKRLEKE